MNYQIKYLKIKNKYLNLKKLLDGQIGGSNRFTPGDRFITKAGDKGTIIRRASIDEFGLDLYFASEYYVVEFDKGNTKSYDTVINVSSSGGTYRYVADVNDLIPISASKTGCKFNVGDKVILKNGSYFIIESATTEYLSSKIGHIKVVLPIIGDECIYNIKLTDGRTVAEVYENKISKYYGPSLFDLDSDTKKKLKIYDPFSTESIYSPQSISDDVINMIKINEFIDQISPKKNTKTIYVPKLVSHTDIDDDLIEDSEYIDEIIDFFYKKVIKWMNKDIEYKRVKKHLKFIKSQKGHPYIEKIIRSFVRKNKISWYELRSKDIVDDVKDYIKSKLISI